MVDIKIKWRTQDDNTQVITKGISYTDSRLILWNIIIMQITSNDKKVNAAVIKKKYSQPSDNNVVLPVSSLFRVPKLLKLIYFPLACRTRC